MFCASYEPEKHFDRTMFANSASLARQGVSLGGVDTGPFVLASAGLLDGYRCAVHWESLPGFRESYPSVDVTTALYEIDRDRMTCAGGAASIDMMLEYVARTHGRNWPSRSPTNWCISASRTGQARRGCRPRCAIRSPIQRC